MISAHLIISGRVQGVGFRFFVKRKAENLGLSGWVKNLPDGRVEAVFEGIREAVEEMIELCRKGPEAARVDDIIIKWSKPKGIRGFVVRF